MQLLQARTYAESDRLLAEEQWAQITMKMNMQDGDSKEQVLQYNVFERRLADKLSYLDWKLSYTIDEEDFSFIHAKENTTSNAKQTI